MNKIGIAVLVFIIIVVAGAWIGVANYAHWRTTVMLSSQVKVSQVNVGYDWLVDSEITEVLGFDGKENLSFFGNVSQNFTPNHQYIVTYHADYRGFWAISAWTLVSVQEIKE